MYPGVAIIHDLAAVYGPVEFSRNRDHYHCEMAIKRERERERGLEWKNWCKGWEYSKISRGWFSWEVCSLPSEFSNPLEDWNQSPYKYRQFVPSRYSARLTCPLSKNIYINTISLRTIHKFRGRSFLSSIEFKIYTFKTERPRDYDSI